MRAAHESGMTNEHRCTWTGGPGRYRPLLPSQGRGWRCAVTSIGGSWRPAAAKRSRPHSARARHDGNNASIEMFARWGDAATVPPPGVSTGSSVEARSAIAARPNCRTGALSNGGECSPLVNSA